MRFIAPAGETSPVLSRPYWLGPPPLSIGRPERAADRMTLHASRSASPAIDGALQRCPSQSGISSPNALLASAATATFVTGIARRTLPPSSAGSVARRKTLAFAPHRQAVAGDSLEVLSSLQRSLAANRCPVLPRIRTWTALAVSRLMMRPGSTIDAFADPSSVRRGSLDHRLGGRDRIRTITADLARLAGAFACPGGAHGISCPSQS